MSCVHVCHCLCVMNNENIISQKLPNSSCLVSARGEERHHFQLDRTCETYLPSTGRLQYSTWIYFVCSDCKATISDGRFKKALFITELSVLIHVWFCILVISLSYVFKMQPIFCINKVVFTLISAMSLWATLLKLYWEKIPTLVSMVTTTLQPDDGFCFLFLSPCVRTTPTYTQDQNHCLQPPPEDKTYWLFGLSLALWFLCLVSDCVFQSDFTCFSHQPALFFCSLVKYNNKTEYKCAGFKKTMNMSIYWCLQR